MIAVLLAVVILLIGLSRRIDVYASFIEGAQEGLKTAVGILPYLCAALLIIAFLRGSGVLDRISALLEPLFAWIGLPTQLLPFLIMRPVSGSGALSALQELMEDYGVDSPAAFTAAALMGSSETVLYVVSVYLGAVRMRSSRYVIWASVVSMLVGMAVVLLLTQRR